MRLKEGLKAPRDSEAIRVFKRAALDAGRTDHIEIKPGTTIAEAIRLRTPRLTDDQRRMLRVVSHEKDRSRVIEPDGWGEKLKHGAFLLITDPPMSGVFRQILQIVVAVAAFTIGTMIGGPLGGLVAGALAFGGNYLVNMLFPPRLAKNKKDPTTYSVEGFRNQSRLDGMFPLPVGSRHRFAPPFAVPPYIDIVDGKVVLSAVFCSGFAPQARFNEKIGDRLINRFQFFEIEHRGFADEAGNVDNSPLDLVRETVIQKGQQILLRHRDVGVDEDDDSGPLAEPTILETAPDTRRVKVIFSFPRGLSTRKGKKKKLSSRDVQIRIRVRPVTPTNDAAWVTTDGFSIVKKTTRSFFEEWEYDFGPEGRGAYEVEFFRTRNDDNREEEQSEVELIALQSILPEYPINAPAGTNLALTAVRIRATNQLQGTLDEFNAEYASLIDALNPATGEYEPLKETGNSADWYRRLMTMPLQARPVSLEEMNAAEIAAWHAHNVANNLTFSWVYDYDASLEDAVLDVCAAGRAFPRITNGLRGVSFDAPKDPTDAYPLTPHNSWGFEGERSYGDFAHAFRVKFRDRTNRFRDAVRDIVRPGFTGDPTKFDILEPIGLTVPDEAFIYGLYHWLQLLKRATTYTVSLDWQVRMLQHGDLVLLLHRVLHKAHASGFVSNIVGKAVALSDLVKMEEGKSYAIKFQALTPDGDPAPSRMVTWPVVTEPGERRLLRLVGEGDLPERGALYAFGEANELDVLGVVQNVEPTEDGCGRLTILPYAGEIFDELANTVIPPYNSRIGSELPDDTRPPPVPLIEGVNSSEDVYDEGEAVPDSPRRVRVYVKGGEGVPAARTFEVRHRLASEADWRPVTLTYPVFEGSGLIATGYSKGDPIKLQPRSLSRLGVPSAWGPIFDHTVGEADAIGPTVSAFTAEAGADGLDRYTWFTSDPTATAEIRIGAAGVTDFDALTPIHSGFLTASPFLIDNPTGPGSYTVGIRLTSEDGDVGAPTLIPYSVTAEPAPSQPTAAAVARRPNGYEVMVAATNPNEARVYGTRLWRGPAGTSFIDPTTVDVSGLLLYGANALATATDAPGSGRWTYWMTAETEDGSRSGPSNAVSIDVSVEAEAYFARMTTAPSTARKELIRTLLARLFVGGGLMKRDALYLLASHDAQSAKLNVLSSSYTLTEVAGGAFTVDRGYAAAGTGYLDTGFAPATAGGQFAQNDAYIEMWSTAAGQYANADVGNTETTILARSTSDSLATRLNASSSLTSANTNGAGYFALSRFGSTTYTAGHDGVRVTRTSASVAPSNLSFIIGGRRAAGGVTVSARPLAEFGVGRALAASEEMESSAALRDYFTAIGAA